MEGFAAAASRDGRKRAGIAAGFQSQFKEGWGGFDVLKHVSLPWSCKKAWACVEAGGTGGGRNTLHRSALRLEFLFFPVWCVTDTSQAAYLPYPM